MFVPCTSPTLFVLEYNAAQARTGLAFAFLADCDREIPGRTSRGSKRVTSWARGSHSPAPSMLLELSTRGLEPRFCYSWSLEVTDKPSVEVGALDSTTHLVQASLYIGMATCLDS